MSFLPTLNDDNAGFDRLEILTHVQAHAVRAVRHGWPAGRSGCSSSPTCSTIA